MLVNTLEPLLGKKVPSPWTYFAKCGQTDVYKIGTSSSPAARLRQLQTGNHRQLEIVALTVKPEMIVHEDLRLFRLRGEWFDVPHHECVTYVESLGHTQDDTRLNEIGDEFGWSPIEVASRTSNSVGTWILKAWSEF